MRMRIHMRLLINGRNPHLNHIDSILNYTIVIDFATLIPFVIFIIFLSSVLSHSHVYQIRFIGNTLLEHWGCHYIVINKLGDNCIKVRVHSFD